MADVLRARQIPHAGHELWLHPMRRIPIKIFGKAAWRCCWRHSEPLLMSTLTLWHRLGSSGHASRPTEGPNNHSHDHEEESMDACPLFRRSTSHTSGRNGDYHPNHRCPDASTQTRALLACPHRLAEAPGRFLGGLRGSGFLSAELFGQRLVEFLKIFVRQEAGGH